MVTMTNFVNLECLIDEEVRVEVTHRVGVTPIGLEFVGTGNTAAPWSFEFDSEVAILCVVLVVLD